SETGPPIVVLVNANHHSSVRGVKPLRFARVSAFLKENKIPTEFIDANNLNLAAEDLSVKITTLANSYPEKQIFICLNLFPGDKTYFVEFLSYLPRELKSEERFFICARGHLPAVCKGELLKEIPDIDFIIAGEAEFALVGAVRALSECKGLAGVENIIYRGPEGQIVINPNRVLTTEELDSLPFLDWGIVQTGSDMFSNKIMLDTSYGCPGNCTFCIEHCFFNEAQAENRKEGAKLKDLLWRPRSAKRVVDEIEFLHREFGGTGFDILDNDFIGTDPERARAIAEGIIERGLKISFWILTRADAVCKAGREIFALLQEAGLKQVFVGVESDNNEELKYFRKGITREQNREAIEILQGLGIVVRIGLINFCKESNFARIRNNAEFIKKYKLQAGIAYPSRKLAIYFSTLLYKKHIEAGSKLVQTGDLEFDDEFDDPEVAALFDITNQFSEATRRLMVYFRELQELLYYAPSTLAEKAAEYYPKLKEVEFDFFDEALSLAEGNDAGYTISETELNHRQQIEELVNQFAGWLKTRKDYNQELLFLDEACKPIAHITSSPISASDYPDETDSVINKLLKTRALLIANRGILSELGRQFLLRVEGLIEGVQGGFYPDNATIIEIILRKLPASENPRPELYEHSLEQASLRKRSSSPVKVVILNQPIEDHSDIYDLIKIRAKELGGKILVLNADAHEDYDLGNSLLRNIGNWGSRMEKDGLGYLVWFRSYYDGSNNARATRTNWSACDERGVILEKIKGYLNGGEVKEIWLTFCFDFFSLRTRLSIGGMAFWANIFNMDDRQIESEIRKIKSFLAANRIPIARIVPAISRQYLNIGSVRFEDFISKITGKIKNVFEAVPARESWDISGTKCWLFFRRILEVNVGFSEAPASKKNRIEHGAGSCRIELVHKNDAIAVRVNRKSPEFTFIFYDNTQHRVYIHYRENGLVQINVDDKPYEERYSRPAQLNTGFYPCDLRHDFNFYIEGQRDRFTAVMQLGSFPRGLEKIKGNIFVSGSGHRLMLSEGEFNFGMPGAGQISSSPIEREKKNDLENITVIVGGNGFFTFWEEILDLLKSAGLSSFHISSLDRDVLVNPTCTFILDFHKGELIGILGVCGRDGKDLCDAEILTIAVHPEFQHRGIGKKMWSEMMAMLKKSGCDEFMILTPVNQPVAKWIKEMKDRGEIKRLLVSQNELNPWLWSYHACEVSFSANTVVSSPAARPAISYQDAERIMEEAAREAIAIRITQLEEVKNETLRNNRPSIARDMEEEISRLPLTREQTCELACSLIPDKLFREFSIPSLLVSGWVCGNFHCVLLFVNKDAVFVMDATVRQFNKKNNNYFGPLAEYIRRTGFKDLLVYKNKLKEWSRGRAGVEEFEQFLNHPSSPVAALPLSDSSPSLIIPVSDVIDVDLLQDAVWDNNLELARGMIDRARQQGRNLFMNAWVIEEDDLDDSYLNSNEHKNIIELSSKGEALAADVEQGIMLLLNNSGFDFDEYENPFRVIIEELLTNIWRHAIWGIFLVKIYGDHADSKVFEVTSIDHGSGMDDVEAILAGDFVKKGSPGVGIRNLNSIEDVFGIESELEIDSEYNKGTAIRLRLYSSSPAGKDIPVMFRSMPGRRFLCVDAACCFFRDEWIPEEIKKVLRRKYGKDCPYTREYFAIGDLKPKQRYSIIGQSNLVSGFPCWALQIILDFSNSTGLTFVSSCKIYQDRDKPRICGKFPAIKKDLSPCWFELFKQGLWGLYYLVYRDLLEEKPVRTFKEAMGSGEGVFITKSGHSFLSREFEQNPGNVTFDKNGKGEFIVLQPVVNRLVGVYRKEGIKLHLSSSPVAHPAFLSNDTFKEMAIAALPLSVSSPLPDSSVPQDPVIPQEIMIEYRARVPGGISDEFLQSLWLLNTNLKIVLREVKGLYEQKGRLLPPCYIYGGILKRFMSCEPWPITSETDLDVKIIDSDNYTVKDQQRSWFDNMRVHIFPFPGISKAVAYPIDMKVLYESNFYMLDVFLSIKKAAAALDPGTIEKKSSSPVDINVAGALGESKISFRNILDPNISIELALDGEPKGEGSINLLYSIGFNGESIRGNRVNIIMDSEYKEIGVPVVYTLNGRGKDEYKGIGLSVLEFLRLEALRLGYSVRFTNLQSRKLSGMIKIFFEELRQAQERSRGYDFDAITWRGWLNCDIIGKPQTSVSLDASSSPIDNAFRHLEKRQSYRKTLHKISRDGRRIRNFQWGLTSEFQFRSFIYISMFFLGIMVLASALAFFSGVPLLLVFMSSFQLTAIFLDTVIIQPVKLLIQFINSPLHWVYFSIFMAAVSVSLVRYVHGIRSLTSGLAGWLADFILLLWPRKILHVYLMRMRMAALIAVISGCSFIVISAGADMIKNSFLWYLGKYAGMS
ncbi:MAG: GNAT family N-acetyltransferase, partial [Candidatus Omnitrophota bacterium]